MKKTVALLLTLAMILALAACGSKTTGGAGQSGGSMSEKIAGKTKGEDSPAAAEEPACNSYAQVEWISAGEVFEDSGAVLTLYEDGSGYLDFNVSRYNDEYEPDDIVVDPVSGVMYAVDDATAYPFEWDDERVYVYYHADSVYVFEPEESGFAVGDIQSTALEELAESSDTFAQLAARMNEDWIHIKTPEEFLHIADDLSGKYILDTDIDDWWGGVSTEFVPIGTPEEPFTGELDGNGHTITGTLPFTGQDEAWGLFGCNEGYIHDLTVGYIWCEELHERYIEAWDTERSYGSLDEEGLPTEATRYYGVLCGLNRGTLENVRFEDRASVPEMNLYPNENDLIYIGVVCGYNAGTISGVHMFETDLFYRTLDKETAADVGLICGYQTADAVLEDVSLELNYVDLDAFGENILHIAPAVNAGLLIGEAEGGAMVRGSISASECSTHSDFSLVDADLRMGALIGRVLGDIELSGVELNDVNVRFDARDDQEGHVPSASSPVAAGVLIGWADGNVTVSDIRLNDCTAQVIRREGGEPLPAYLGGSVGFCGGDLSARSVITEGRSNVDPSVDQGVAYAGGLCGYCVGTADIEDSRFSFSLAPWFGGSTLYTSSVLGYVCGDASFKNVQADCGIDEYTGESKAHSVVAVSGSTYYLAGFAGAAEGEVTAEDCVIEVLWNVLGGGATLYGAEDTDGLYNPA